MSIKSFIFGVKSKSVAQKNEGVTNPFVSGAGGRKEWNDRYQTLSKNAWDWKKAFFGSMVLSFSLAMGLIHVASQSKIQPFAVEVNNGIPIAIKPMLAMNGNSDNQKLVNYALTQFITNTRTILSDTQGEKNLLDKVYAYSANETIPFMHNYFDQNNPFSLASQYTVSVAIVNSLPISKHTWQITWDETKRSADSGVILSVTRWEANLTYQFSDINSQFMLENPWGLYITQLSWAPIQVASI